MALHRVEKGILDRGSTGRNLNSCSTLHSRAASNLQPLSHLSLKWQTYTMLLKKNQNHTTVIHTPVGWEVKRPGQHFGRHSGDT